MFSAQGSPIAIDFGSATVKVLQISTAGRPVLLAAAEVTIPESSREDTDRLLSFYGRALPKLVQASKCKGKRAVCSVPSSQTIIQHMQLTPVEGVSRDDLVKAQLQTQMNCPPESVVVRAIDVPTELSQGRMETICLAVRRDIVMRYVELLTKCKLDLVGVHPDVIALVQAFNLFSKEENAQGCAMYVDLGWGGTKVAITQNAQIVFARHIQVGGRNFDQHLASALGCDLASARAHRLSLQAAPVKSQAPAATAAVAEGGSGGPAPMGGGGGAPSVDLSEQLDTICDELSMCLRYHQGLYPQASIDRVIFVGGEARQTWLCKHLVDNLRLRAQLGDPLAKLKTSGVRTPGLNRNQPQPGWAVPCGLCTAPTDL
jgi:type IV pilus assembly protein PilM